MLLRQPLHHKIVIQSVVTIRNGDTVIRAKNHFVQTGLCMLVNLLMIPVVPANPSTQTFLASYNWTTSPFAKSFMVLGTNTSAPTTVNMSALSAPIGTAPGTKANSQAGATLALANGAEIDYTSTWNAGTVSGTVGEIGLYLNTPGASWMAPIVFGTSPTAGQENPAMFSRLSSADGDFTAFAINVANPLSITWAIQFTFA